MTATWWSGTRLDPEAPAPAAASGVWAVSAAPRGRGYSAVQVVDLTSPSFIAAHPDLPLIYAVTEERDARLACIDVSDPQRPQVLDLIATGGADACHALLARDSLTLYVSHYSSGDIAVVPLSADGRLAAGAPAQILSHAGSGPDRSRQTSPHAHAAAFAPGDAVLLVIDLGTDELRRYEILADGRLRPDGIAATLPAGTGPRHVAMRGDLIYVVGELDHTLSTLRWDAASRSASLLHTAVTTAVPQRTGDTIYDAHVELVSGVALVSVRGCDVISVFDLGEDGVPTLRASIDCGGQWPRHFAVVGERLVVANERSNTVSVFDLADVLAVDAADDLAEPVMLPHVDAAVTGAACVVGA